MSEQNWKPGDVAMVNGHVAFVWDAEMFVYTNRDGDAVSTWLVGSDARRLVVIDPEDRKQVGRLTNELVRLQFERCHTPMWHTDLADALREFASPTPPKRVWTDGDVVQHKDGTYTAQRSDDGWRTTEQQTVDGYWADDYYVTERVKAGGLIVLREQAAEGVTP